MTELEPASPQVAIVRQQSDDALPESLQARGIRGFITGRISVKIVGPYLLLMFVMALLGTFVVMRLVSGSLEQRFTNQLLDAGKSVNDTVIKIEREQLELLRLMANTDGVDTAIQKGDAQTLQKLLVPLQANSQYSFVDVVDAAGKEVLALRPRDGDLAHALDPNIAKWDVTANSISGKSDQYGNKYSSLVNTSFGTVLYSGGPVLDANNKPVGAILVGMTFDQLLARLTKDVLASVTVYGPDGSVIGTTLQKKAGDTLGLDPKTYQSIFSTSASVVQRPLHVGGQDYMELVGGLVIRDKVSGALGVAIPTSFIAQSGERTRTLMTILFSVVVCVVLVIGLFLARRITAPILVLVKACRLVAGGDLEQRVSVATRDETGVLAHTFNRMIEGLRERDRIRDTFGRYMTQQVSDAILNGDVKLGGERKVVTMLMSDIRGFTTLSESLSPEDLVAFLNRYFSSMIDCVVKHEGVVDKFMGDAILVVYGAPIPRPDHAKQAVLTAIEMRRRLLEFNAELVAGGNAPIRIGIGINTGPAIAGNIGSETRMEYTVIGDTVNATQRVEDLTKEYKTDILISDATFQELDGEIEVADPYMVTLRGRSQQTAIYPVVGVKAGETLNVEPEKVESIGPNGDGSANANGNGHAETTVQAEPATALTGAD